MTRRSVLAGLLGVGLVVGACSAPLDEDLSDAAARALQADVRTVVEAAAQGRYDAATAAAQEVRATLEAAAESGEVSTRRQALIEDALRRTEDELTAARQALSGDAGLVGTDPEAEPTDTESGTDNDTEIARTTDHEPVEPASGTAESDDGPRGQPGKSGDANPNKGPGNSSGKQGKGNDPGRGDPGQGPGGPGRGP